MAETLNEDLLRCFPLPRLNEDGSKEDRGRLLAVAGSRELAGAALLAGIGALRAGAGKLQIATAASIAPTIAVAAPEARVVAYEETDSGDLVADAVGPILGWAEKAQAVLVGPGLQGGDGLRALMGALVGGEVGCPLILDAAALEPLPDVAEALKARGGETCLLPHAGEMAKLMGMERSAVEREPEDAAVAAAQGFGAVALVKGPVSTIAAPDGRLFRYEGGGIGLATSGSGDALAGFVGGLAARGADALTAVLWGVWLHGEAGRALGARIGRVGYLARELTDEVPRLLQTMGDAAG